MRPPAGAQIYAPEFPPKMEWLNVAFLRMVGFVDRNAVLIEFFDTARINSHRTLPYLQGWNARYADHGLRVIGVHSPGYSFGRDRDTVERAAEAMGVTHPVLLDPDYRVWKLYGNQGWPGRYLFDQRGLLRYIHYGEGDYRATEEAIVELLGEIEGNEFDAPEPLLPAAPRGRRGRAAGAPDRRRGAAGRPGPAGAGRRLDRGRGLPGGRRGRRHGRGALAGRRGLRGAVGHRGAGAARDGRDGHGRSRRDYACTASSSRLRARVPASRSWRRLAWTRTATPAATQAVAPATRGRGNRRPQATPAPPAPSGSASGA